MTRETKIGLVVTTMFLSLVGVVIASKLNLPDADPQVVEVNPDDANPGTGGSMQEPKGATSQTAKHDGDKIKPPPAGMLKNDPSRPAIDPTVLPASQNDKPVIVADGKPAAPAKSSLDLPPAMSGPFAPTPLAPNEPKKFAGPPMVPAVDPLVRSPSNEQKDPNDGKPASPPTLPPVKSPFSDPTPLPVVGAPKVTDPNGMPKVELPKNDPLGLPEVNQPKKGDPLGLPEVNQPKKGDPLGLPEVNQPNKGDPLGLPEVNQPKKGDPLGLPEVNQPKKSDPLGLPEVNQPKKGDPLGLPEVNQPKKGDPLGLPEVSQPKKTDPSGLPQVDLPKQSDLVGPPPLAPGAGSPPVTAVPKSPSIGTIGAPPGEGVVTPTVTPSRPGFGSPTDNKGLPAVTNHTEETRYTQAGDTSFEDLSRKHYGTPIYARALLEYNRKHVLAKENVLRDPPILQPNQPIYYPDKNILELRYGQLITGSGGTAVTPPTGPTVRITPLAGPSNVPAVNPPSVGVPPANPPTADATVTVTVAQPQWIFDIASQALGNGNLWPEILRLNPSLQTEQPIPAGTQLRLPKQR